MNKTEFLRISGERPKNFYGSLHLPPSKSYLHRALFVASLCKGESKLYRCESEFSDDIAATIRVLTLLGMKVENDEKQEGGTIQVKSGTISSSREPLFVGGSGTTARFAISFAALAKDGGRSIITGDNSLSKRPMQPMLDALGQLGVECYSQHSDGCLPVAVEGKGIKGGNCIVDGSISSQFISSLLIACTKAENDTTIRVAMPSKLVSEPYIEATFAVLKHFGFAVSADAAKWRFRVKGNQKAKANSFKIPGDMSSAASLIAATLACKGKLHLLGVDIRLPQPDATFLDISRKFGANISRSQGSVLVEPKKKEVSLGPLVFNMKRCPDLVPIVSGLAAAIGTKVKITNVAHLRFKESDRLSTISRELRKLGVRTKETKDSITIFAASLAKNAILRRKPILLDPENDHRILMALTVASLSGRFGEVLISDPSCVNKSYPEFVLDLQRLLHQRGLIEIVRRGGAT